MSQRDLGGKDGKEFRWPTSGYERLLGASAAGRQMHPPFVGSAATRCEDSENGRDFPSLVATDVAEGGNAKVAAGDASTSRRVRFSDEDAPRRNVREIAARLSQSGIFPSSTTHPGTPVQPKQAPTPKPVAPLAVAKKPTRSVIRKWRNPADTKASKSNGSSESMKTKSATFVSIRKRTVSVSTSSRRRNGVSSVVKWSSNGLVNVKMNNAAIKRQNHIRQRLRAEWIACHGDEKLCPFR